MPWVDADRHPVEALPPPLVVGLNVNDYGAGTAEDALACVSLARVDTDANDAIFLPSMATAGLKINVLFPGDYPVEGGAEIKDIDVEEWAAEALALYSTNLTFDQAPYVEVLNEPFGFWFWGDDASSSANRVAYRNLLKATHAAFHTKYGSFSPQILGAYEPSAVWWTAECREFVDGIVVHAYGGTGSKVESAEGNRPLIEEAHAKTSLPVHVTEIGWPTAIDEPATSDSLQWTEAEQATNIETFMQWAKGQPYIAHVDYFNYRDFGTNTHYGIEQEDGTKKLGYTALKEAAA